MVQMGVRQQDTIDGRGIEPKGASVLLRELTAALKQPAIDEDPLARAFDQMTRSGHVAIRTVKFQFQDTLPTPLSGTRLWVLPDQPIERRTARLVPAQNSLPGIARGFGKPK